VHVEGQDCPESSGMHRPHSGGPQHTCPAPQTLPPHKPVLPVEPSVPPASPTPPSSGQHNMLLQVVPAAQGEEALQGWVLQGSIPLAQRKPVTQPLASFRYSPSHQLHEATGAQLLLPLVPPVLVVPPFPPIPPEPVLPPLPPEPARPPLPPEPAPPLFPPAASTTPPSELAAQSTRLHPQDVNVWHCAPAGHVPAPTGPTRVYPLGQYRALQQTVEPLELPPAPPLAGAPAVEAVLPPWLVLPPLLVTPPCADVPPELPPTGASMADEPPASAPPVPVEALPLPAVDDPPASGALPSSCVLPPQAARMVAVIKLTENLRHCVVFIMSCLVGDRVRHSHRSSRIRALMRAR
jgi:homeobox protein ESX1